MCPENYFVDAFQARIEPKQGSKDDTALNGLNFRCKNPATSDNKIMILYLNYLLFYIIRPENILLHSPIVDLVLSV